MPNINILTRGLAKLSPDPPSPLADALLAIGGSLAHPHSAGMKM